MALAQFPDAYMSPGIYIYIYLICIMNHIWLGFLQLHSLPSTKLHTAMYAEMSVMIRTAMYNQENKNFQNFHRKCAMHYAMIKGVTVCICLESGQQQQNHSMPHHLPIVRGIHRPITRDSSAERHSVHIYVFQGTQPCPHILKRNKRNAFSTHTEQEFLRLHHLTYVYGMSVVDPPAILSALTCLSKRDQNNEHSSM